MVFRERRLNFLGFYVVDIIPGVTKFDFRFPTYRPTIGIIDRSTQIVRIIVIDVSTNKI